MKTERRYGCWGGNPKGTPEDPAYCIESVCSNARGAIPRQCNRKRGHGADGLYCKQHDPEVAKARSNARTAKWDAEVKARQKGWDLVEKRREIAEIAKKLVPLLSFGQEFDALAKAVAELEEIEKS